MDLIVGGPPCQGFSSLNRKKDKSKNIMKDAKNQQVLTFIEYVKYFRPKCVLMENVTGMLQNSERFSKFFLNI